VTGAATALSRKKLIDYSRGRLEILDRARLEAAACECYLLSMTLLQRVASSQNPAPAR
jgi:hypothetical protein